MAIENWFNATILSILFHKSFEMFVYEQYIRVVPYGIILNSCRRTFTYIHLFIYFPLIELKGFCSWWQAIKTLIIIMFFFFWYWLWFMSSQWDDFELRLLRIIQMVNLFYMPILRIYYMLYVSYSTGSTCFHCYLYAPLNISSFMIASGSAGFTLHYIILHHISLHVYFISLYSIEIEIIILEF